MASASNRQSTSLDRGLLAPSLIGAITLEMSRPGGDYGFGRAGGIGGSASQAPLAAGDFEVRASLGIVSELSG